MQPTLPYLKRDSALSNNARKILGIPRVGGSEDSLGNDEEDSLKSAAPVKLKGHKRK